MIKVVKSILSFLVAISISLPMVTSAADSGEICRKKLEHPFLFINSAGGFQEMQKRSEEEFNSVYSAVKAEADEACVRGPLEYYESESEEENWMRDEADTIFKLTLVYKISGDVKYKEAAWKYIVAACGYPSWGRGTAHKNRDLACAHMLIAFSVYYDWIFDELSDEEKTLLRNTVCEKANDMYTVSDDYQAWWRYAYMQNHMWVCTSALMTAAAVFWEDFPVDAKEWAEFANEKMQTAYRYMPKDGSLHEGIMYFRYGMTFLRYFNTVAEECFGKAEYKNSENMKNAGYFLINMLLPLTNDGRYGNVYNFADCPQLLKSEYVSQLYSFAHDYNQPEMRYIADLHRMRAEENLTSGSEETRSAANTQLRGMWQSLIFAQTEGESVAPSQEIFNRVFEELGYVFSRYGTTDSDASGFAIRCGSLLGSVVQQESLWYNPGLSHIHADVNSLLLYADGQLLLSDDGYGGGYTADHNTLTVNGIGQTGDGKTWDLSCISAYTPHIVKWESNESMTYAVCDGTAAYSTDSGLKKFRRHILFIKPDILITADEIETDEKSGNSELELRFFPSYQNGEVLSDGSLFFGKDRNVNMYVKTAGDNASLETVQRMSSKTESQVISIKHSGVSWMPVTAFVFGKNNEKLPDVSVKKTDKGYVAECIREDVIEEYAVNLENAECAVRRDDVYVLKSDVSVSNDRVIGTATVKNLLPTSEKIKVILGIYNSQGLLRDVTMSEQQLAVNEEKEIAASSERIVSNDEYAKLFIWRDDMKPCAAN